MAEPRPSIVNSSRWVLFGRTLTSVLQMAVNVLLARRLGPAEFGAFGLANAVAITVSCIIGFGLSDAAYKFVAEYGRRNPAQAAHFLSVIWWTQLIAASLCFAGLWLLRHVWQAKVFPMGISPNLLALCLLLAWVNVFVNFTIAMLNGWQLFRELNLLNALQFIIVISVAVIAAGSGGGAMAAYLAGSVIFALAGLALAWRIRAAVFAWPPLRAFLDLKRIAPFAAPNLVSFLLVGPLLTAASVYLVSTTDGKTQLGLFNTANTLRNLVAFLPLSVTPVLGAAIVQEGGAYGDEESHRRLLINCYAALGLLAVVMLVGFLFLGDWALIIYGPEYAAAFPVFLPMAATAAVNCLLIPINYSLLAKGKVWWSLAFLLVKAILILAFTRALADRFGAIGLAWATLLAEAVFCVLNVEYGIWGRMAPVVTRRIIYGLCLVFASLLAAALALPAWWRWTLALPLAFTSITVMLRLHPALVGQLTTAAPGFARPWVERSLHLLAPAPAA
jgi:O-antigen/teichoic acid export membrane protein